MQERIGDGKHRTKQCEGGTRKRRSRSGRRRKSRRKRNQADFEEQETVSKKVSAGKKRKRTDEAEVRCCTVCFGEGGGRGREDEKKGRNTT